MMCESQVVPRICDAAHTMEALKVRSKDIHAAVVEERVNRYHQEVDTLQSVTKEGYVQEDGKDIKEETTDKCMSVVIKEIDAPVGTVWSVVRRFDMPQAYKRFARTCRLTSRENGAQTSNKEGSCCLNEHGVYDKEGICCPIEVGCVREVEVVSGLPATWSRERLEVLDDENHVLAISIIGGHHRLRNYRSVTTLHSIFNSQQKEKTLAVESYVVDVPEGNTVEDTKVFIDTIVRCNLQSLADVSKRLHQQQ